MWKVQRLQQKYDDLVGKTKSLFRWKTIPVGWFDGPVTCVLSESNIENIRKKIIIPAYSTKRKEYTSFQDTGSWWGWDILIILSQKFETLHRFFGYNRFMFKNDAKSFICAFNRRNLHNWLKNYWKPLKI